jgi:hypothetical protein
LKILEEKLATDFTGCTDLIGQKKVQKTSAFAKATAGQAKKIRRRLPKLTESKRQKTDD